MSYKGVCTPGKGPGEGGALKSLSASELLFSGPLVLRVYVISIVEKKLLCFFVRKKERKYNLFVNKKIGLLSIAKTDELRWLFSTRSKHMCNILIVDLRQFR